MYARRVIITSSIRSLLSLPMVRSCAVFRMNRRRNETRDAESAGDPREQRDTKHIPRIIFSNVE